MNYSANEVMQYVREEDVKFIRMAFCDVYGRQKNISIMPDELGRAFEYGIAIDASSVAGFGGVVHSDLVLHPDPVTLSVLPWRPEHGRVVRMFCSVCRPDGTPFENDCRAILASAERAAADAGYTFAFGSEMEFYLFKLDEHGEPTRIPYDNAGYMDIAPEDKGENVRREICLTLEQMGIKPESSHHEQGPGQNEIDFRYSSPLRAGDDAVTFKSVVGTVAARSGLAADFDPRPLSGQPGNGMHINFSVHGGNVGSGNSGDVMGCAIAGLLAHIREISLFLCSSGQSYERLGHFKSPKYISWSHENRSQLIRIPAAQGEYRRAELRSPDPLCNPYLAYSLIIHACLDGIMRALPLPPECDRNMLEEESDMPRLPATLAEARAAAAESEFLRRVLPQTVIDAYLEHKED